MSKNQVAIMADRLKIEPDDLQNIVINTVMPNGGRQVTNEQFVSFLAVANEYKLNPMTKEIYAFPAKGGGIQPIVSIDGWLKIINSHPTFDGMEFSDTLHEGKLVSITCRMYRVDRNHPTEVTEYMDECRRNTDTWKQWPARMLRHKAAIQAARYAFGFSGIVDPDEAERIAESKDMGAAQVVEDRITADQARQLRTALQMTDLDESELCQKVRIDSLDNLEAKRFGKAMAFIKSQAQNEEDAA